MIEAILLWCFPLGKNLCRSKFGVRRDVGTTVKNSTRQLSEVPSESSNAGTPNEQERFSTAPSLVLSTMAGFDSHKGSQTGA